MFWNSKVDDKNLLQTKTDLKEFADFVTFNSVIFSNDLVIQ